MRIYQMKLLYLFLALMMTFSTCNAYDYATNGFAPLQPIQNTTNKKNITQQKIQTFKKLPRLEQKVFNRTFNNDIVSNRIARLEEQIFGTIQSGDLISRYTNLQKAVPKYSKRTDYSQYCAIPTQTGWRGLAGSLGNFFTQSYMGHPTGFSPQIVMPDFNNITPDYQRANFTNRGWNIHNQNFGTGSAVHILD